MDWIEVNGVGLRYELSGHGQRTVVLIHEMGGTLETWDFVAQRLSQKNRVLRYDMRGAGMSEKVRGPLSIEVMTDDLLELLNALGLLQPVVVVGCAVGAAIAVCFAGRHEQRTAGLVAMSPSIGVVEAQRQSRHKQIEQVEHAGMRSIVDASLATGYPPVFRTSDPARFASFRARWLGNDPDSFATILRMLILLELDDYMKRIRCPALVVGATYDSLRPPASSEEISKRIPGGRFIVLETGHHMPVLTPDLVSEAIAAFLNDVAPGR